MAPPSLHPQSHLETTRCQTSEWTRTSRTVSLTPMPLRRASDTRCLTFKPKPILTSSLTQSARPPAAPSTSTRRSHSVTRSTTEFQTSVLTLTSLITSLISKLLRPRSHTNSVSELMPPRPDGTTQPRTSITTSPQNSTVTLSPPTRTSATTGPLPERVISND